MELDLADFRELFDAAPVGLAVLDRELRYLFCNEALAVLNGVPASDHIGCTIGDIVPVIAVAAEKPFRSVFETGEPVLDLHFTGDVPANVSAPRSWVENVRPIFRDGRVAAILVSVQEVTALEEAQRALRASEQALQASQALNPDGFAILRAVRSTEGEIVDLEWEYANPAAQRAAVVSPLVGRRLLEIAPAGGALDNAFAHYVKTLEERGTSAIEFPYENGRFNGWFRSTVVAIDAERIAISFADITKRKRHEEALTLALHEFRHRVKNLLAVVSSLVSHARRTADTPAALAETIQRQLQALGTAQDLLLIEESGAVPLAELAGAALKPFNVADLQFEGGPEVSAPTAAVLPFTLALHELATNAIKHGALSREGGRASISWSLKDGRVTVMWRETGGPDVTAPTRTGFGSKLFKMLEQRLQKGSVTLDYQRTGLIALIAFDL